MLKNKNCSKEVKGNINMQLICVKTINDLLAKEHVNDFMEYCNGLSVLTDEFKQQLVEHFKEPIEFNITVQIRKKLIQNISYLYRFFIVLEASWMKKLETQIVRRKERSLKMCKNLKSYSQKLRI